MSCKTLEGKKTTSRGYKRRRKKKGKNNVKKAEKKRRLRTLVKGPRSAIVTEGKQKIRQKCGSAEREEGEPRIRKGKSVNGSAGGKMGIGMKKFGTVRCKKPKPDASLPKSS